MTVGRLCVVVDAFSVQMQNLLLQVVTLPSGSQILRHCSGVADAGHFQTAGYGAETA